MACDAFMNLTLKEVYQTSPVSTTGPLLLPPRREEYACSQVLPDHPLLALYLRTRQDGEKFWKLPECYIRGSNIKYVRLAESVVDSVREQEEAARKQRQAQGHHHHHGGQNGGGGRGGGTGGGRGGRAATREAAVGEGREAGPAGAGGEEHHGNRSIEASLPTTNAHLLAHATPALVQQEQCRRRKIWSGKQSASNCNFCGWGTKRICNESGCA